MWGTTTGKKGGVREGENVGQNAVKCHQNGGKFRGGSYIISFLGGGQMKSKRPLWELNLRKKNLVQSGQKKVRTIRKQQLLSGHNGVTTQGKKGVGGVL